MGGVAVVAAVSGAFVVVFRREMALVSDSGSVQLFFWQQSPAPVPKPPCAQVSLGVNLLAKGLLSQLTHAA
jgi:hypothetical protein